jgi:hypothetical protein
MNQRQNDSELYYRPKGGILFNVKYKSGTLDTRVTASYLKGRAPAEIEWVWIVGPERRATAEEIKQLCAGTWRG